MKIIAIQIIFFSFIGYVNLFSQISFPLYSSFKYLKGSEASGLSTNWVNPDFDDNSWNSGNAPFWYGDGSSGTELSDMQNNYSTFYMRSTFEVQNVTQISSVLFTINYDDGFIIYINGEEVLNVNAPNPPLYDAFAPDNHESGTFESFNLNATDIPLTESENNLAVQGFNVSLESSDFHFNIQISAETSLPIFPDSVNIVFSHESGFYDNPFTLYLDSEDPTADIVYTVDGSNPQNSATAVNIGASGSIGIDPASTNGRSATPGVVVRSSLVKSGYRASYPVLRTFIFTENVKTQTSPGGIWPDYNVNDQIIYYEMDSRVVNDSRYTGQMTNALTDIPSISIATDNMNLFDPSTGIYVNAWGHGYEWERECSVELIDPNSSDEFNINAGLRIRGGWSRHNDYPKHSFRLFFREEYGKAKLDFPLFGDEGTDSYDKIDLRTAQNYAWSNGGDVATRNTFLRDVFSRDLQRDMGQPYTRSRFYHLYLNGMYWGLYQTQERSEARFAADYLGDNREDYDVVKVSTENWEYQIEATDGNLTKWQKIYNMCNTGFASNEAYFKLEGKAANGKLEKGPEVLIDIDNLIDYMLTIFYTGNFDAPTSSFGENDGPNNFYAICNRENKSKGFVFFNHDAEHAMFTSAVSPGIGLYENRVNLGTRADNMKMEVWNFYSFHPQWLHYKLTANSEYLMRFKDRAYKHMTGEGALTEDKCLERFNTRRTEIETAIIAESARWGAVKSSEPYTKDDHWIPEVNSITNTFFPRRTDIVINQMKNANLYSDLDAPKFQINGTEYLYDSYELNSSRTFTISNPNSEGTIYYTTDNTDPRLVGGSISSSASQGQNQITLNINSSAVIKSRILADGEWSPIREIRIYSDIDDYSQLKITEIHYHPLDEIVGSDTTSGKSYEFIEFKNIGENAINLAGLVLDSAVYYEFPLGDILAPANFYVVASKPKYFYERYGKIASGNFQGNLSNSGENILLNDPEGNEIFYFAYDDHSPWPEAPDGDGNSLVPVDLNPTGNPNDFAYWRASYFVDGSPFRDDDGTTAIDPDIIISQPEIFTVYPNPTNGLLNITTTEDKLSIAIYDLQGKLIYTQYMFANLQIELDELNIEPGFYLIKANSSAQSQTFKILYLK